MLESPATDPGRAAEEMQDVLRGLRRERDSWKELAAENAIAADRYSREAAQLRARLHEAEKALRPFAGCVFNDNGDVTVSTGHLTTHDWLTAKRARAALTPAPEATQEAGDGR